MTLVDDKHVMLTTGRMILLPRGLVDFKSSEDVFVARFHAPTKFLAERGMETISCQLASNGRVLWEIFKKPPTQCDLSDDGTRLSLSHGEVQSPVPYRSILEIDNAFVAFVSAGSDNSTVTCFENDGTVRWHIAGSIGALSYGPDEQSVAVGGDQVVRIISIETGRELDRYQGQ